MQGARGASQGAKRRSVPDRPQSGQTPISTKRASAPETSTPARWDGSKAGSSARLPSAIAPREACGRRECIGSWSTCPSGNELPESSQSHFPGIGMPPCARHVYSYRTDVRRFPSQARLRRSDCRHLGTRRQRDCQDLRQEPREPMTPRLHHPAVSECWLVLADWNPSRCSRGSAAPLGACPLVGGRGHSLFRVFALNHVVATGAACCPGESKSLAVP